MPNTTNNTILVVDDHESSRYARGRVLRRAGYEVVEAATGQEALEAVARVHPQLILLDVQLPDINGLDVCRKIKGDPATSVIPVLHMSATNITGPDQVRGLEGGADGYLVEPVAPEVLVATVGALLRMRRAENESRESRRALNVLVSNLPGAAYRSESVGGRLTFVSGRVEEVTGFPGDELLGEPSGWWGLIPPEDLTGARALVAASPPGTPLELVYRIRHRDGTVRWLWDRMTPVNGPGGVTFWEGFATDMTERKAAQEVIAREQERLSELVRAKTEELQRSHEQLRLTERLAALGTLSAGLGHDMANLLVPLRVRLENLKATALPPGAQEEVEAIWDACDYLRRLAGGLRLLAVDSSAPGTAQSTEVHDWWNDVSGLLRSTLTRHIDLTVDLPPGECWVAMSKTGLTQAVFNLVQNAGEAMKSMGQGAVSVGVKASDAQTVTITVRDSGPGMAPEVAARCLEPFFTTKPRGVSTGLGLALVYALVNDAAGRLSIDSAPGKGTTFSIMLRRGTPPVALDGVQPIGVIVGVELRDKRIEGLVIAEARRLGCDAQSLAGVAQTATVRVVDRPELVGDSPGRVMFAGDEGTAPQGTLVVGVRPKLQDIRQGLVRLVSGAAGAGR